MKVLVIFFNDSQENICFFLKSECIIYYIVKVSREKIS